jgi:hypothetical protein
LKPDLADLPRARYQAYNGLVVLIVIEGQLEQNASLGVTLPGFNNVSDAMAD